MIKMNNKFMAIIAISSLLTGFSAANAGLAENWDRNTTELGKNINSNIIEPTVKHVGTPLATWFKTVIVKPIVFCGNKVSDSFHGRPDRYLTSTPSNGSEFRQAIPNSNPVLVDIATGKAVTANTDYVAPTTAESFQENIAEPFLEHVGRPTADLFKALVVKPIKIAGDWVTGRNADVAPVDVNTQNFEITVSAPNAAPVVTPVAAVASTAKVNSSWINSIQETRLAKACSNNPRTAIAVTAATVAVITAALVYKYKAKNNKKEEAKA